MGRYGHRATYSISTRDIPKHLWDGWLIKMQMKAFGWVYMGGYKETEIGITEDWKAKTTVTRYLCFRRFSPYTNNLLFCFAEVLSNIIMIIRAIISWLFVPACILLILVIIFGDIFGETFGPILIACIILAPIIILALSFLIILVGSVLRNGFRLEERLLDDLEENGYDYDSIYDD
ncbi:MAG: hypothetical protein LUF82_05890 [Clostridia bacterium]|nr:hypothetical protein [Clostridia bacterium]